MKNSPTLVAAHRCRKGSACDCPGYTYVTIERGARRVAEVIAEVAIKCCERGLRCPPYVLIGWHDYHLLRNEINLPPYKRDDLIIIATPAGEVRVLVDPAVEVGVRALPHPDRYELFLGNPKLLEPR